MFRSWGRKEKQSLICRCFWREPWDDYQVRKELEKARSEKEKQVAMAHRGRKLFSHFVVSHEVGKCHWSKAVWQRKDISLLISHCAKWDTKVANRTGPCWAGRRAQGPQPAPAVCYPSSRKRGRMWLGGARPCAVPPFEVEACLLSEK